MGASIGTYLVGSQPVVEGLPSYLVSKTHNGEWERFHNTASGQLNRCPRSKFDWIDVRTGEVVGGSNCKAYVCDFCGPRKLWLLRLCLAYVRPERFLTLTLAPGEWGQLRAQLRDFARRVRGAGYAFEWAWAREANPKGTGYHVHALQRGDYVPHAKLERMWGGRFVQITSLRSNADMASAYLLKEGVREMRAAGYTLKDGEGRRPIYLSRGFCGEGRTLEAVRKEVRMFLHPAQESDDGRRMVLRYR